MWKCRLQKNVHLISGSISMFILSQKSLKSLKWPQFCLGLNVLNLAYGIIINRKLTALLWSHDGRDGVSNHQPHGCLFNRLFKRRSKKTSKLRATGLCAGNSPGTGEFPAQRAVTRKTFPFDDVIMVHSNVSYTRVNETSARRSENDLSQPRHETSFWWRHNRPIASQSTDPL